MLELDAATSRAVDTHEPATREPPGCYCNSPAWCVAHTHPQAERWADTNLRRAGYVTYLPLYTTQVRDRAIPSLRHTVVRPLFTSYIFVQHIRGQSWRPIYETPGVHSLIRSGTQLQYAPDAAVSALRATEDIRRYLPAGKPQWAPGTPCSLAVGVFAGLPAVVLNAEQDQVRIGVMFLGQIRQMSVPAECIVRRGD